MLHDRVLPYFGVPEEALYLTSAVMFSVLLWRFRPQPSEGDALLALGAGAFWAASIGADLYFGIRWHAIADGSKMIGTALWTTFLVRRSFGAIIAAVRQPIRAGQSCRPRASSRASQQPGS